jgi:hypothetical protein
VLIIHEGSAVVFPLPPDVHGLAWEETLGISNDALGTVMLAALLTEKPAIPAAAIAICTNMRRRIQ